ncbi:MAG TPA: AzlC family ABC transporter permease [Candidatus Competibacteraceae bacterium]|nr:AzlC family ABC transporter permease [Candidatus Competibacteraceae bacterium]
MPYTTVPGTAPGPTPRQEFWSGARAVFPLIVGAIPFGLIFGTLASSAGLSLAATLAMSAFVFAGSSQFIAVGLLMAGASVPVIILTTFVVNLRHLLYAASLLPHVGPLAQRWKLPLGFTLTDEAFAVAIARYQQPDGAPYKHWFHLGAALGMYLSWQLCTLAGVSLGQAIPDARSWGLDFAMSATFLGMLVPYLRHKPLLVAVLVAGSVALLAHGLPHQLGLMVAALAGIAAGVTCEHWAPAARPCPQEAR